jgi:hypothetical protein
MSPLESVAIRRLWQRVLLSAHTVAIARGAYLGSFGPLRGDTTSYLKLGDRP